MSKLAVVVDLFGADRELKEVEAGLQSGGVAVPRQTRPFGSDRALLLC